MYFLLNILSTLTQDKSHQIGHYTSHHVTLYHTTWPKTKLQFVFNLKRKSAAESSVANSMYVCMGSIRKILSAVATV